MKFFKGHAFRASVLLLGALPFAGAKAIAQQGSAPGQVTRGGTDSGITTISDQPLSGPAESAEDAALPDDPGALLPQQQGVSDSILPADGIRPETTLPPVEGQQTKRILFMVPNFRAVSADSQLRPQLLKEKLKTASLDSLDYSSFLFYGIQSGIGWITNSYPEFHQNAAGYGRYYWHTTLDSTDENYWVEFIVPAVLHQDTRYYTLGKGGFVKRFTYAFSRAFITRTDEGNETINASEMLGSGISSSIANLYYPSEERTLTKTYQRWVTNFVIDGGTFVFKEFWPDLNNRFFHQTN